MANRENNANYLFQQLRSITSRHRQNVKEVLDNIVHITTIDKSMIEGINKAILQDNSLINKNSEDYENAFLRYQSGIKFDISEIQNGIRQIQIQIPLLQNMKETAKNIEDFLNENN